MREFYRENCLKCGKDLEELSCSHGLMRCPNALALSDVINEMMPKCSSDAECDALIVALKKSGYKISARFSESQGNNKVFSPVIPIIRDLAMRLARHEAVNGAHYHPSQIVCPECVSRLSTCSHGHTHAPKCPICGAELDK